MPIRDCRTFAGLGRLKTKDGAEHVYDVGKDATIASGGKIAGVGKLAVERIPEGAEATIHFSEEAGQKVVHFFSHER